MGDPTDKEEWNGDNVLREAIGYMSMTKLQLARLAADADGESSVSSFMQWSKPMLFGFVIEHYPCWND